MMLDDVASDVLAFAKNEPAVHFEIPYVSAGGGVRYYRPDFLIRTPQAMYVVETKGLETLEVPRKDQRMARWCQDATALTGQEWRYVKVSEALFDSGPWDSLAALERASDSSAPLGGPVPAGRLVVAPRGGPIGLLRKPMVDDARPSAAPATARSLHA